MTLFNLQRFKETIWCVLPASLPLLVFLLITPSTIYIHNQDYFNYNILLLIPFAQAFCIGILLTGLVLFVLPSKARLFISTLFFFSGIYLLVTDFVTPIDVGDIIHGTELSNIPEPLSYTLIEMGCVLLVLVLTLLLFKKRFQGIASFLVIALLAVNIYEIQANMASTTQWSELPGTSFQPDPIPQNNGPNCYQLFFDAYNRDMLLENIETLGIKDDFDGFIFYKNNLSNGWWTTDSIPSLMSGTLYKGDIPFTDWIQNWFFDVDQSIFSTLKKNSYRISFYTTHPEWRHDATNYYVTSEYLLPNVSHRYRILQLLDMTILRLVPTPFKNEVIHNGGGLVTKIVFKHETDHFNNIAPNHTASYLTLPLIENFIADEKDRKKQGEYVFLAAWIPHGPIVLDADCHYCPATGKEDGVTFMGKYKDQAICATKKMHEIIKALKEKGVYKDSLIIFHSDHGFSSFQDGALMVKPPGRAGVPLEVSERETMLLDIPATIYDSLNIKATPEMGRSILSGDFPSNRTIPMVRSRRDSNKIFTMDYTRGQGYDLTPPVIKMPNK